MKRIATFAAMFALAACGAKTEAPKADSTVAPAAATAPAEAAPAMSMDSTKKDSTAMAAPATDTAKKM